MIGFSPLAVADTTFTPIVDIHGPNDTPAKLGQTVSIRGVVTATYPTGGIDGFYMQTGGTGGSWDKSRTSSEAIFVYLDKGSNKAADFMGKCLEVTGEVATYPAKPKKGENTLTQIKPTQKDGIQEVKNPTEVADCAPVKPLLLDSLPTDAQKETLEGMLVKPTTVYTVTDNYSLNTYGLIGLTTEDRPLPQATDVAAPGAAAKAVEEANVAKFINLDDGSTWAYNIKKKGNKVSKNDRAVNTPLPYLTQIRSLRVGAKATFINPVILTENHGWVYQPTTQITGTTALNKLPVSITDTRTSKPVEVLGERGDIKVSTFNLLNYFTDLGEKEAKCGGYPDRDGNLITADGCQVRGAYREADFKRQEAKLVKAINTIDADVFALEEVENSAFLGKDRDEALKQLVQALNTAKGTDNYWSLVPSPKNVPNNGDAIRVAMIYKTATIKTVGESSILDSDAFTGLARSPLAQKFIPIVKAGQTAKDFVLITNHFKSKGAHGKKPQGADPNADKGDGQGYYNGARIAQAKSLVEFTKQFKDSPIIMVGDFNSYTMEDPIQTIKDGGFTLVESKGHSYVYSGRVGSMDHAFVNPAAKSLVTGATVWEINAQEPVALEYSRYNNNVTNFYSDDVYRASDHNPEVLGLDLITEKTDAVTPEPKPTPQPNPDNAKPGTVKPADKVSTTAKKLPDSGSLAVGFAIFSAVAILAGIALIIFRKRRSHENEQSDLNQLEE